MAEKIELEFPIEIDGVKTDTLHLRRPKVRDIIVSQKGKKSDVEQEVTLISNLCEINPAAVEELDAADYKRLSERLMDFFG